MRSGSIKISSLISLFLLVFSMSSAVFAQVDERAFGGAGITLFTDRNFRGNTITYTRDMPNLVGTGFNNTVSSLKVGPGERWEICDSANYRGQCAIVWDVESDLRTNRWENRISSLRRVNSTGPTVPPTQSNYIVLYDQVNYRGNPSNIQNAASSLDRRAQSVTVGGGSWQLCEGFNFTGRCVTINQSVADLRFYNLNGRVASARPVGMFPTLPPVRPSVTLYSQSNYRGVPTTYRTSQARIAKTTGSVKVTSGEWELCSGYNFTGTCKTLTESRSNMTIFGIFGRTIRSVRPLTPQPR